MRMLSFTAGDWEGHQGCESFFGGNPPLRCGSIYVEGQGGTAELVVDANYMQLTVDNGSSWHKAYEYSYSDMAAEAAICDIMQATLRNGAVDAAMLMAMGWKEV